MYKVEILTVGKTKEIWLQSALQEYEKRLTGRLEIRWRIAKTTDQLKTWVEKEPFLIVLSVEGKLKTSQEWGKNIFSIWRERGARLVFLIGGAEGIPFAIPKSSHQSWSLSPLTFTHQMTRLILLEQLYRAFEEEKGSSYGK